MKIFGALLVLFMLSYIVPACMCVDMGEPLEEKVRGQLNSAAMVFEGKAAEYLERKGTDRLSLRFTVDRVWNGEVFPEFELATDSIMAPNGPAGMNSCEYHFEKGKTYIVFASKGRTTNQCSGNLQVKQEEQDKAVLKVLGPGKEPEKKLSAFLTNKPFELIFEPDSAICLEET